MDMQQMMQQLLARMDAWGKEMNTNQQKLKATAKANREQMMADRIADQEYMKQMMASTDDKQERMAINLKEMEADRNGD
jgi:hypothetical protein